MVGVTIHYPSETVPNRRGSAPLGERPVRVTSSDSRVTDDVLGKVTDAGLAAAVVWRVAPEPALISKRQKEPAPGERRFDIDDVPQRRIELQRLVPKGVSVRTLANENPLQVQLDIGSGHIHPIPL